MKDMLSNVLMKKRQLNGTATNDFNPDDVLTGLQTGMQVVGIK